MKRVAGSFRPGSSLLIVAAALAGAISCGDASQSTSPSTSATKNLSMRFCALDRPIWVAAQAEEGKWVRVNSDADGVFRVAIGLGGGIAIVRPSKDLEIVLASVDELSALFGTCQMPIAGKTIRGDVAGLANQDAQISLGSAQSGISDLGQFELHQVQSGPQDFVASRFADFRSYAASSLVIRRAVNVADGATLPTANFQSTEAFSPTQATVTLQNFESLSELWLDFLTANGLRHGIYYLPQSSARQTYVGIPSSRLVAGDVQLLEATDNVGVFPNDVSRVVSAAVSDVVDQTLTFGPAVSRATLSSIAGSTHARWHAVVPVQSEYSSVVVVGFSDAIGQSAVIIASGAFLPKAGNNWDLAIPDFSSIGFDRSFGVQSSASADWFLFAQGGGSLLPNRLPGSVVRGSFRQGSTGATNAVRSSLRPYSMRDLVTRGGLRFH